ncbi:protein phosphatase 1G-like isoform X2 [Mercenaria mercenaria]|uniref:protein phosphatase 1G-like isoform X2 n=1 Tax=Mercenaria mercenaria TaxID=6596 RepID=UPI00234F7E33|nr:protein phosphatase 1G-like isoform X2 [Mercenaria mercenaria]
MGVYLSSPVTEKFSSDKECPKFTYGVSSMQGWRMSQEDAHNCISDFDPDTNTSLFAVYDGHGGAEVAQYTAAHLPDFLKALPIYKDGKLAEALQEAFLGFDQVLTQESVIQELKTLAGVDDDENEEVEDDEGMGRSERDILVAEANMPIEELMAKYSAKEPPPAARLKKQPKEQFKSPMIRAKKTSKTAAADNSDAKNNNATSTSADPIAARLDTKLENGQTPDNDNNLNVEKELREAETHGATTEPDSTGDVKTENKNSSSSSAKVKPIKNGENSHEAAQGDMLQNDACVKSEEPDSTSDKGSEVDKKPGDSTTAATDVIESSQFSSSRETPSGSGGGSSGSNESQSGMEDGPSSAGGSSDSSSACSSSSGSGAGSSGSGTGSSDAGCSSSGPSGSGVQASGSRMSGNKKVGFEIGSDSDDDSSDDDEDDDEYVDDSDEDDEDEDDEDDEELEGGIFGMSRVSAGEDEEHAEEPGTDSGCTAVLALLRDDKVYVANAGDSRCVMCQAGKAVELSFDHKPEDDSERTRIEAAGGRVTNDGRVNGGLNLSRALGDHWYKRNEAKEAREQMISALPDVECATLTPEDEFLIIACDGIWNFLTSQETVDFVRERLKDSVRRDKPSLICEELFDFCLAPNTMGDGTGCDNMTCIIIVFNKSLQNLKRDSDNLDVSTSEDTHPEKRPRLEDQESVSTDT